MQIFPCASWARTDGGPATFLLARKGKSRKKMLILWDSCKKKKKKQTKKTIAEIFLLNASF